MTVAPESKPAGIPIVVIEVSTSLQIACDRCKDAIHRGERIQVTIIPNRPPNIVQHAEPCELSDRRTTVSTKRQARR